MPPLTLHHLRISQSERIIFLLEELSLPYTLICHTRSPLLSPPSLKSLPGNETGKSPFLVDEANNITLSESAAIVYYIMTVYGKDSDVKLCLDPEVDGLQAYRDYIYWFHYANGTLQPEMMTNFFLEGAQVPIDNKSAVFAKMRMDAAWRHLDERLATNKWLAGEKFTAADILMVYSCTTQRYWGPKGNLAGYGNLCRWLRDCMNREGYKRAMEKGDPEMRVLRGEEEVERGVRDECGVEGGCWRKRDR